MQRRKEKGITFVIRSESFVYLVCLFFEIFYKVIDLLFYLTGNDVWRDRSIEPAAKFIMSVR